MSHRLSSSTTSPLSLSSTTNLSSPKRKQQCSSRGLTCSVDAPENWQQEIKQCKTKKRKRRETSSDSTSKKVRSSETPPSTGSPDPDTAGSHASGGEYVPPPSSASSSTSHFSSPLIDPQYQNSANQNGQNQHFNFGFPNKPVSQFHHHNSVSSHNNEKLLHAAGVQPHGHNTRVDALSSPNVFWMPPTSADSHDNDLLWKSGSPLTRPGSAFKLNTPTDFGSASDFLGASNKNGNKTKKRSGININTNTGSSGHQNFSPTMNPISPLASFGFPSSASSAKSSIQSPQSLDASTPHLDSSTPAKFSESAFGNADGTKDRKDASYQQQKQDHTGGDSKNSTKEELLAASKHYMSKIDLSDTQKEQRSLIQNLLHLNKTVISDPANPFFARFNADTPMCILSSENYARSCSVKHPFILACSKGFEKLVRVPQKTILIDNFPCYFEFPTSTPFLPQNTQRILKSANQLLHANVSYGKRFVKVGSSVVRESFVVDGNVRYCKFDLVENGEWTDEIQLNGKSFPKSVSVPKGKDLSENQVTQAVQLFYQRLLQL